jgi:hypothetical protein
MTKQMLALGFTEGERDPKTGWYADLGTPVSGLWYGHRVHEGQWQYVSLCAYLGDFVEAVVQVYQTKFNSRQKPQQTPLFGGLCRNLPDLQAAVAKKYELPKGKA